MVITVVSSAYCDYVKPVSKTLDVIQELIAHKLHNYKQVSTLQEVPTVYISKQVLRVSILPSVLNGFTFSDDKETNCILIPAVCTIK